MGEGLNELRFTGTDGAIRIFYFFVQSKKIVFVHGFVKKQKKAPKKELDLARKRMKTMGG